ncbi:MAG: hypothetical protein VX121_05005 [Pseudomonadota bacterium]|nr:hypothetical protein [Pseudomonadota bacterium]
MYTTAIEVHTLIRADGLVLAWVSWRGAGAGVAEGVGAAEGEGEVASKVCASLHLRQHFINGAGSVILVGHKAR